ncbi:MAG: ribonuclease PH [Candidatus Omnitrophica bacterium]|nr:ribonuclease PH [Candidatus Omnitrophota bacterium]
MKRNDGRAAGQLRKIKVHKDYNRYAEGSCLIEMGHTRVVCTATADKYVPVFLRNSGQGWVTAEYRMLPRATQNRTLRDKISGRNMEIQRLIGRGLRSVVDTGKLGERTLWIDCDVLQADGGTRIASLIGGYIALVMCVDRLYEQKVIAERCVNSLLGAVSVGILNGTALLDLSYDEDSAVDVDMNLVMKPNGQYIEIQGAAERGTFSQEQLNELLTLGRRGIEEIFDLERNLLKDIVPEG